MRQLWKVARNNKKEHGSKFVRAKIEDKILDEIIAGKIYPHLLTELEKQSILSIGKGGLINSKWVMVMDFERIKKERGFLPLRILDHVTYMYYLAFFIDKNNPRKQGKITQ